MGHSNINIYALSSLSPLSFALPEGLSNIHDLDLGLMTIVTQFLIA
ncbi:hypothetical protein FDUTEX481_09077 [Tolypothrix sp. PCC 7601]|nr:hypothetical protein FDUTEX481_09077 [Tolypothrix sp. PCC 7601]